MQRAIAIHADSVGNDEVCRKTVPEIEAWVARSRGLNLSSLPVEDLIAVWGEREKQVLDVFGPETLLPSLICGMVWADLETFLHENFWDEHVDALVRLIAAGGEPDCTVVANAELFEVGMGKRRLDVWLVAHGHCGAGEFDLAAPRWREQPNLFRDLATRLITGEPPLERFHCGKDAAAAGCWPKSRGSYRFQEPPSSTACKRILAAQKYN